MFAWLRRRTKAELERRVGAAIAHHEAGRLDAAQAAYEEILRDDPSNVDCLHFLGFIAFQRGAHERALEIIARALALNPAQPRAHQNLGNAYQALGRHAEAAASFERAAALAPQLLEAHYNLGIARRALGQGEAAAAAFRAALRVDPNCAEAHYALGQLAADGDRLAEALRFFEQALALRADYAEARWALALCRVPQVYGPGEDPARARAALAAALGELERWCDGAGTRAAAGVGAMQPFSLAYDEEPNREVLQRYGHLCAEVMARVHRPTAASHRGTRIRVGIVSAQLREHSVWHALVKGWFAELDRARFELHAFHLGTSEDGETGFAKEAAARFVQGRRDTGAWVDAIAQSRPDVLIYPEIGMDPMTVRLAALRLAPVQAASWGHPETTGLPTVDYYLSAQALEPPRAEDNYSEQLVLLPGLGCHFEPRRAPRTATAPALEVEGPLLVCPGVPFKYAPRCDWVLAEIARRLGSCRLVFFEHSNAALSARLRERLRGVFAARGLELERCTHFLPWLPKAEFQALLERADLALDTIGFSGFNTALQAVECALPMVTREGRFLRGRLASGILRRLGLDELVTRSEEEYVERVLALAADAQARGRLRAALNARRDALYRDEAPIGALEDFLSRHA